MSRKEKKYHFIYKTTNLLSGKYYIGMHSTDNLEDGYLGSGNRIRLAVRKHGKENFKREILEYCETREELGKREEDIVNLDEIAKVECMNLIVGGVISGFMDEEHMIKCSVAGQKAFREKFNNDLNYKKEILVKMSLGAIKAMSEGKMKPWSETYDWTGKNHSDETKHKISESMKGKNAGTLNSQYGSCWITKDGTNKKIKKEDLDSFINNGWVRGRK